jgi:proline iminopeptidase
VNGGLLFDHKLLWPALSPLAQNRQLILYDQRGRGASQVPAEARAARIEHDAGDVAALRNALGFRQWDVLGHSWGGAIAVLGAEQDRQGVRRLVLVSPVGPRSDWLSGLHAAALDRLPAAQRGMLARIDPKALETGDPGIQSAYSRAIYPAWFVDRELAAMFSPPRSTSVTGATIASALRGEGYDWTPLLRGVRAETLVVYGTSDLLPLTVPHDLVAAISGARLALIPDAGHMPFLEAPRPFFAAVENFLHPIEPNSHPTDPAHEAK